MMEADIFVFNILNGFTGNWFLLDFFFFFCAKILPYLLILPFLYLLLKDHRKYAFYVGEIFFAAFFVRYALCEAIRHISPRERPLNALEDVNVIIPFTTENASLPSGHVAFFFALSTVAFMRNKKAGSALFFFSFLIALSRVAAGVHWPSDVVIGALVGLASGFIVFKLSQKICKKRSGQTEK